MKHSNFLFWLILFCGFGTAGLHAQETILAAGGDASGSGGSISISVGQIANTTSTGTNGYSVAFGVQQPYEISVIIGVEEDEGVSTECLVYPNPVKDHLTLKIDAPSEYNIESMEYRLYDLKGNLLQKNKLVDPETFISMTKLVPATYFLKITDTEKEIKIFKIIKN